MDFEVRDAPKREWDDSILSLPGRHILQSWEWGEAKRMSGWKPDHKIWRDTDGLVAAAALILSRSIKIKGIEFPLSIMYIPRGPILRDWRDSHLRSRVLKDLHLIGKRQSVIFIKMDPEVAYGRGIPGENGVVDNAWTKKIINDLEGNDWIPSPEQIQFRNSMLIDLRTDPEQLLANMKQKTRYNIRLAERRGVTVRPGNEEDLSLMFKMYAETSIRDGFTIRNIDYYITLWRKFISAGLAEPLLAEVDGEVVAGVFIFRFGGRAWYMYGMSREVHREKMPNYLLQWEAIRRAKTAGCVEYDLWGAPDNFDESDDLWGVYRFKAGLGAEVVRYIGAWDLPLNWLMYRSYTQLLPRILELMRRRGEEETRGVIRSG